MTWDSFSLLTEDGSVSPQLPKVFLSSTHNSRLQARLWLLLFFWEPMRPGQFRAWNEDPGLVWQNRGARYSK